MNILNDYNIIKTIEYLERNRETVSADCLHLIMVHTLENENKDDYNINEHLQNLAIAE